MTDLAPCKKVFRSQYASSSGFSYPTTRCGKSSKELTKKKKLAAKKQQKKPAAKKQQKKPTTKEKPVANNTATESKK